MVAKLNPKKWSHFKDREFLESLADSRENLLLIGPPKSGKTELIRDLFGFQDTIRINCLIFDNFAKLTADLCEKLSKHRKINVSKPPTTFAHLLLYIAQSKDEAGDFGLIGDQKAVTVVFENAHILLELSYDSCSDFFKVYSRFVDEISLAVDIHTMIVSKCEMPVEYFKIALPYPNKEKLMEFVSQKYDEKCDKITYQEFGGILRLIRQNFIITVLEFEIIVHDFDSFDLLTSKIFSHLKRDLKGSQRHYLETQAQLSLKNFPCTSTLIKVFFFNIKAIYYSNKELREMAKHFDETDKGQQNYGIFNSIAHMHTKMLESMPIIACYILLGCYIASSIPQSKDHTVLGVCKSKTTNRKEVWQKQLKHKAFSISRAISIVEVLMENSRDRQNINEQAMLYHSTEFYMIFDFFERIGWLKESGVGQIPKYYKFICDPSFISVLIKKLGLEQSEFFFHGN